MRCLTEHPVTIFITWSNQRLSGGPWRLLERTRFYKSPNGEAWEATDLIRSGMVLKRCPWMKQENK